MCHIYLECDHLCGCVTSNLQFKINSSAKKMERKKKKEHVIGHCNLPEQHILNLVLIPDQPDSFPPSL